MLCRVGLVLRAVGTLSPRTLRHLLHLAPPPVTALLAIAALVPPPTASAVERAYIIHGGDRTLASAIVPAGPVTLNLDTVGLFPSEMVRQGAHGWVPCGGSDRIDVVDLAGDPDPDPPSILTGAGTNPYGMAFATAAKAYASLLTANSVVPIDPATGTTGPAIPVGRSPQGMLAAGGRVLVANTGFNFAMFGYDPGTISIIDPATDAVIATLPVGLNPQAMALAPNGEVHVICTGNYFSIFGRIFVIDPVAPAVIDSLDIGGSPGFIAINGAGTGYVSDYFLGLLSYDAATRAVRHGPGDPIAVGTGAAGVDFDAAGRTWVAVYGDDQLVGLQIDDSVLSVLPVGDGPQDVVLFDADEPVAVTLVAFTAVTDGDDVMLAWRTSAESNHAGFRVEQAPGFEGPWSERGWVSADGAPDGRYEFADRGVFGAGAPFDAEAPARLAYRLVAVDRSGGIEALAPRWVEPRPAGHAVTVVALRAPAPNPLRSGVTRLAFRLAAAGPVVLTIHDPAGREVARPLEGVLDAGEHTIAWDGRTSDGRELARGVYFLRLAARGQSRTGRIVLAR